MDQRRALGRPAGQQVEHRVPKLMKDHAFIREQRHIAVAAVRQQHKNVGAGRIGGVVRRSKLKKRAYGGVPRPRHRKHRLHVYSLSLHRGAHRGKIGVEAVQQQAVFIERHGDIHPVDAVRRGVHGHADAAGVAPASVFLGQDAPAMSDRPEVAGHVHRVVQLRERAHADVVAAVIVTHPRHHVVSRERRASDQAEKHHHQLRCGDQFGLEYPPPPEVI